jgi:hypothetical protein
MVPLNSIIELSIHVAVGQTFEVHMFERLEDALLERHVLHLFEFVAYVVAFI